MELHEARRDRREDVRRIGQVLAQADHYGADSVSRAQLSNLPVRTYPDLAEVLAALGLYVPNRRLRAVRPPPAVSQRVR